MSWVDRVKIRFATEDDFDWILREHAEMVEKYPPMRRTLELAVQEKQVILPELDGKVIGMLRFEYLGGAMPYMAVIFIDPDEYQAQGLGTSMLEFLEDHLRGLGHKQLLSSSETIDAKPQEWHRKRGFREAGLLLGTNDTGAGELFFLKDI